MSFKIGGRQYKNFKKNKSPKAVKSLSWASQALTLEKASRSNKSLATLKSISDGIISRNPLCISASQICSRCGRHKRSARTSTFSTGILSREEQRSVYRYSNTAKKLWQSTPCNGIWNKNSQTLSMRAKECTLLNAINNIWAKEVWGYMIRLCFI